MQSQSFIVQDIAHVKRQVLAWASTFSVCSYLDSNQAVGDAYSRYELLVGIGVHREIVLPTPEGAFAQLRHFHAAQQGWLFGFLSFDIKNDVERLTSENFDGADMPALHFFEPLYCIALTGNECTVSSHAEPPDVIWAALHATSTASLDAPIVTAPVSWTARIGKEAYLQKVAALREHIIAGDVYEINLCQEFFAEQVTLHPVAAFYALNALTRMPFAAFYKYHDRFAMCASPERYLQKQGAVLLSQPIKGTLRRGSSAVEDEQLRQQLQHSEKDRAENVMIVDLVRNDLARVCHTGTVRVPELFGVHTFSQVHQLISTISGELRPEYDAIAALRATFPMGSMTGAPKVMALHLIEAYEHTRRGLYSGAIGYFSPEGNFDFNVVIRTLLYNAATRYLSFQVGGAIVYDSVPEKEYEECLLKAAAFFKLLGSLKLST